MSSKWVFLNGDFIQEGKACLHISDLSIQRGYGVFDFLLTQQGVPIFIDDHLNRFLYSAQKMRLPLNLLPAEIKEIVRELIKRNNLPYSGVRLTLTGGYSPDGYTLAQPNFIITQQPLTVSPTKAIRLITYEYQRDLPDVKTINYTTGIWLQPIIQEKGADDVLYYTHNKITECPRSNFFIVDANNTIVTPQHHILRGITRKKVLELAKPYFKVGEKDIALNDFKTAKAAFITSTTKGIVPVTYIDDTAIGHSDGHLIIEKLSHLLVQAKEAYLKAGSVF